MLHQADKIMVAQALALVCHRFFGNVHLRSDLRCAMATGPVLRTDHQDHDTERGGGFGGAQHTNQCVVLAGKVDYLFATGHGVAIS